MKKILPLLFCCLLFITGSLAQSGPDSLLRQDTIIPKKDTVVKKDTIVKKDTTARNSIPGKDSTVRKPAVKPDSSAIKRAVTVADSTAISTGNNSSQVIEPAMQEEEPRGYTLKGFREVLNNHPYFDFSGKPLDLTVKEKKVTSKDSLFYFITALLVYFGLIRLFFGKYLNNLLALFFRATMRQQQIRDQLLQSPLPSMLLNFLFLITGGLFLTFVSDQYAIITGINRWILLLYGAALLLIIYTGKMVLLKVTGWVFNVSTATDTYIFIIFLVNKIMGIFLLPLLVVLAFAGPPLFSVMLTLAFVMLVFMLGYRFVISYKPIRNEIKVNRFHFFLYLCAFEIAPLLLIYKVLLIFLERGH